MANYFVKWTIDIEADSPEEAAQKALEIQRNPESIATCFSVKETTPGNLNSGWYEFDLDEV